MSFVSSEDQLLGLNLWPTSHSEMIAVRAGPNSLSSWEQFPRDLERMFNWATIAKDVSCTDKSRENMIIYRNPPTPAPNAMYPISVRLYGCLQAFNVGKFGNWDGDPSTATRATQSISLISGGHDEAWQNQLDNLNIASAFASRMMKLPLHRPRFPSLLYFQRRVFRQADPDPCYGMQTICAGSLCAHPTWEWNDALPILQITANHECIPLHEILLNRFDFVEVDAEFNLVVSRPKDGSPTLKIFLSFKHLVRLLDASASKVTGSKSQKRARDPGDSMASTPTVKRLCAITRARSPTFSNEESAQQSTSAVEREVCPYAFLVSRMHFHISLNESLSLPTCRTTARLLPSKMTMERRHTHTHKALMFKDLCELLMRTLICHATQA